MTGSNQPGPCAQVNRPQVRLLCDGTLGALCRWLRAAGYDTEFLPPCPREKRDAPAQVHALREASAREERLVLTRSRRVQEDLGERAFLVQDDVVFHQILEVSAGLDLTLTSHALTRCREDNALLERAVLDAVRNLVPPYVAATQTDFVRCPRCSRVYWAATHTDSMMARLEELEQLRHARLRSASQIVLP